MSKKQIVSSLIVLSLLISAPLIMDWWLASKLNRHKGLVLNYECFYDKTACQADLNNDGIIDSIVREKLVPYSPDSDSALIVSDGPKELYELRVRYIDNTLRTHVATRDSAEGARLLVFDGIQYGKVPTPAIRMVLAWNGQTMVPVSPSPIDWDILSAMAAYDDAGTFSYWSFYTVFRWPILLSYAVLLVLAGWQYKCLRLSKDS